MKYIIISIFMLGLVACKDAVDVVENNETIAIEGEIADFQYEDIEGTFKGNVNNKPMKLYLNDGEFTLTLGNQKSEGNYNHINDGSIIELESKAKIQYKYFKIEELSYISILESLESDDSQNENNYFLEKSEK